MFRKPRTGQRVIDIVALSLIFLLLVRVYLALKWAREPVGRPMVLLAMCGALVFWHLNPGSAGLGDEAAGEFRR